MNTGNPNSGITEQDLDTSGGRLSRRELRLRRQAQEKKAQDDADIIPNSAIIPDSAEPDTTSAATAVSVLATPELDMIINPEFSESTEENQPAPVPDRAPLAERFAKSGSLLVAENGINGGRTLHRVNIPMKHQWDEISQSGAQLDQNGEPKDISYFADVHTDVHAQDAQMHMHFPDKESGSVYPRSEVYEFGGGYIDGEDTPNTVPQMSTVQKFLLLGVLFVFGVVSGIIVFS